MSDFYKIIADENILNEFVDWLSDTNDSNQYYITLFARKKYDRENPALLGDKLMLKRITSQKKDIIQKLKQMECRIGAYTGNMNLPVPNHALAVYISISPRDLRKAAFKSIKSFAEKLEKNESFNPRSEVLNNIQTSRGENKLTLFDVDDKSEETLEKIFEIFRDKNVSIIETRGGYHVIVDPSKSNNTWDKLWYRKISELSDVTGDSITPICGCYQGGFIPKLLNKTKI